MRAKLLRNAPSLLAVALAGLIGTPALPAQDGGGITVVVNGADAPGAVTVNPQNNPKAGGGYGGAGKAASVTPLEIPHSVRIIESMVNSWIRNSADIPYPNQVPSYRNYPPTVALTSLVELDDKTADKIEKMNVDALAKGRVIAQKYGKKLDTAYRARLQGARALLSKDDQALFDVLLKAWDVSDEAYRSVTEPDPKRRFERIRAEMEKSLADFIKTTDVAKKDRLLMLYANRSNPAYPSMETDAHAMIMFGQSRLEWAELFPLKDGDKEKLAELDKTYLATREMLNADLTKDLNTLYAEVRTAMIAAIPSEKDRADLAKIDDWNKSNGPKLVDAHQQQYDAMKAMNYDPTIPADEQQKRNQDGMKQYTTANQAATDLYKDLATTYPERFKDKVGSTPGWGGVGGSIEGQGERGGGKSERGNNPGSPVNAGGFGG
jgi:hypothetical protein